MSSDLAAIAAFTEARLAEWEAAALESGGGHWEADNSHVRLSGAPPSLHPVASWVFGYAPHIALHDPATVLRLVTVLRAIVALHMPADRGSESDEGLHARFAHPAWEYATTEGQRKAWDRVGEPPEGDGWERNTAAGRDGWDRFEYTEESYWRRLRPEGPRPPWIPIEIRHVAAIWDQHPDYVKEWAA